MAVHAPAAAADDLAAAFSPARIEADKCDSLGVSWTLWLVAGLCACALAWMTVGRLDRVAVASGRLVAPSAVQVVQPYEAGIVGEILVKEGQYVERGALLLRMEASFAEADRIAIERSVALNALHLRRIDAELADAPFVRATDDPQDLYVQVERQYRANVQAFEDTLAQQRASIERARQALAAAQAAVDGSQRTLPMLIEQDDAWRRLAAEGFAGRLLALDRTRARVERETQLAEQMRTAQSLNATAVEAIHRYDESVSRHRSDLRRERADMLAQHTRLVQEQAKSSRKAALLELRAPLAGTVKDLSTHTVGTIVQPAAVLLTLVPGDQSMVAEVLLRNEDAPVVHAGQPARVKILAYPFQRYGVVEGTIEHVAPDALERRAEVSDDGSSAVAGYRARVRLHRQWMDDSTGAHPLRPGLLAQVEVNLGTRSVLEYLVSPIQKVVREAGRER